MKKSGIRIMYDLIGLVRPLWMWMIAAVVLGVLGFLCSIMITVFGAIGIIKVLGYSVSMNWMFLLGAMGFFGVARGILRYGEQASNHYIAFKILALIRDRVFRALRRLCPAKLEGRDKGNLINMLTSDVELLEVFYAHTISPILIAAIVSIVMSLWIAQWHLLLGVFACVSYIVVGVVLPIYLSHHCKDLGIESRNSAGTFASFLLESLRGVSVILQFGAGESRAQQLNEQSSVLSEVEGKLRIASGKGSALTNTAILTLSLGMLALAYGLWNSGFIGKEAVLVTFVSLLSSFGPVTALANLGTTLQNTLASGKRVLDVLDEEEIVKENREGTLATNGDVYFNDVTFAYEKEAILKDVSLHIKKGEMTGILGTSGSGKSTLLKLLMRFWDVDKGKVVIDNQNIQQMKTSSLRDLESYMTQETHLFHDTIENNIRFVRPAATHEEIVEACKKASIHDFIIQLPNGYESHVTELGESLSGGEKQRIGLARVFLYDADLILLDEPTSNLDALNEAVILKSLDQQKKEKTILLVSHRPSTLRLCDHCIQASFGRKHS
ncbi:amino acid ABC transporter ATP-binding/permease protein [Merdibacter massiliensis]|uniref:amino acid ABC transporter ATP-binding/permease protein n=1 Tax=Merdibacter massiliensis TaxID=1871030 RepID=UPI00192A201B|nr:ABC transporter ATP-binding protein [Merdibacter massiliensis]